MNLFRTAMAVGAFAMIGAAQASDASSAFGSRDAANAVDLSPDGNRVVYVAPGSGRANRVVVANLSDGSQKTAVSSDGSEGRITGCRFVSDTRLVCRIEGEIDSAGLIVPFSRMFAVNDDGSNPKPIGQRNSGYDARIRQFDAEIVDWLSGEDNVVLVAREYVPEQGKMNTRLVRSENGLAVDRVDVGTLEVHTVERPSKFADSYFSDGHGNVRMKGWTPERGGTGMLADRQEFAYRMPGSTEWRPFSTWDGASGMVPLAVDGDTNSAYVLKKLDGRVALYRVRLDGSMHEELVYKHPAVDVDGLVRIGRAGRVIGVTFAEEARHDVYFDPTYTAMAKALQKALKTPRVSFLGASKDGSRVIVRSSSDVDPGHLYLFDSTRKTLDTLLVERPALEGIALSPVKAVTVKARDGTPIPAYLTLPPGVSDAKHLPAIVLPHGGPSARDEGDFDWLAQFLAHQGYAVIQPNYRGSAGYGDDWRKLNGFRGWKTSVGDVVDSGRWLLDQGIADPGRLFIAGWSYGGYAALQSTVVEPTLFKAVVAIAPVTDLDLLKRESLSYTNHRNVVEEIGDGPHIKEGSPLRNVDRIKVPVLLFHGDLDHNVAIEQSRAMNRELRSAGKSSELVEFAGLEHQLDDSNARTAMLDRIAAFLDAQSQ